ncbi:MAG: TraB/GumN family protein [Candidatus ainarchaeum sp.]|nr:TraB/GumN family protein [Candidatus ainarchaeum sp.]
MPEKKTTVVKKPKKSTNLIRTVTISGPNNTSTKHVLLGTAHISKDSVKQIKEVINKEKPDVIAIELCEARLHKLTNQQAWKQMNIFEVIKSGNVYLFLLNLYLANLQKKMGEKVGVMPGQEMLEAYGIAKAAGIPIVLADRDVQVTLKRAMLKLNFIEKFKMLYFFFLSFFKMEDQITPEKIEEMKNQDLINQAMEEMVKQFPHLKEVLVDERDQFISEKIRGIKADKVLTIVGAGHLEGIEKNLKAGKKADLSELNKVRKKKKFKLLQWLVPILFIGLIVYGFMTKGLGVGLTMLITCYLVIAVFSAISAIIAGARLITILAAFFSAPFAVANPLIATGWIAGAVETWADKPKVEDFLGLSNVKFSFKELRRNRVSRILLIVALCNIGATIGSLVALPIMLKFIF